jgi:hypothetical protein
VSDFHVALLTDGRARWEISRVRVADVKNLRGGNCDDQNNESKIGCHRRLMKPFPLQGCSLQGISDLLLRDWESNLRVRAPCNFCSGCLTATIHTTIGNSTSN